MANSIPPPMKPDPLWQDRDVRFDCSSKDLSLRKGENVLQVFSLVEDTKGNSGDMGTLTLSNLRIIWQSGNKPRINLSVGLSCIISISNRSLHSKLRGKYDAIHIMSKVSGTRYEFIYTQFTEDTVSPIDSSSGPGAVLPSFLARVCKAYSATKLFRDLKLRSAVVNNKQLKTLPSEEIYSVINGVWNLSSDQGNLGTMYVTSVRIVWYANLNELFNLSLPFLQINGIRVRDSKFGRALVIESSESSGGYILGFRVDPLDRLKDLSSQLVSLLRVHAEKPNMGVEAALHLDDRLMISNNVNNISNLKTITDESEFHEENNARDPLTAYMTLETKKDRPVVFDNQLGVAIEELTEGFTIDSLWKVLPEEG